MSEQQVELVVVGSIGIDTIETPFTKRVDILGGSASYACAAASLFSRVGMVGVVGRDFPSDYEALYNSFRIDLAGLQSVEGKTFRWSGVYKDNMDDRDTLSTELNVLEHFAPTLPASYVKTPFLFLANIGPDLQQRVLEQMEQPRFVVMDTMDLWINIQRDALSEVIGRVDLLTLNESEARRLSGDHFLPVAAEKLLAMGPRYVLIKKGEHGSMLFSADGIFVLPAFPLSDVQDPTGAGDAFAGGFMGALASMETVTEDALRQAMVYGSVVASFAVEAFSLDRLQSLTREEIEERATRYRNMIHVKKTSLRPA